MKRGAPSNNQRRSQPVYFADRKFLPRVREFLEASSSSPDDVEDVVDYLRESFHEYGRKKRIAVKQLVVKALNNINATGNTDDEKIDALEDQYFNKRHKKSQSSEKISKNRDKDTDNDSDFSLDEQEDLVQYKDTNAANNSMQNLYRITAKSSTPSPVIAASNLKENIESPLEWKIDKTPSKPIEKQILLEESTCTNSDVSKTKVDEVKQEQRFSDALNSVGTTKDDAEIKSISRKALVSEDERSMSSRPGTPLNKSISKSARRKTEVSKQKKFEPTISKKTFKDVGGCASCLQEVSKLLLHLKHPEVFKQLGIQPPRGFLLHGAPGCGKTLLANAIAGELQIAFFKIAAPEVVSGISGDSEQKIRSLFTEATLAAPSILFIDEIDSITPKRESAGKEMERRVVTQILTCMDELANADAHVLVIGATNRADAIDPALRRAGRFDREIAMGIPDKAARKNILQILCRDLRLADNFDYDRIASKTPGFVGADIQALAREAAMCAVNSAFQDLEEQKNIQIKLSLNEETIKSVGESSFMGVDATSWLRDQPPLSEEQLSQLYITTKDFEDALPNVQPSAKREGFATVPDVTWEDIGALEDIREELTMAIMAPVQNPDEFESLGLTTPPGILLAGPPGCGKTLLAKAIANEAGINFISVKGPELLNMYVGESEKAVRQVFERARNSSPCVIFFDEIDALCPKRSQTGDSTASSRVVNQLLTEMDGLEARKQVFIMAATNRPDILDSAILRPGRLDKLLYVGLPDINDREKILLTVTKNGTKPQLADDVTITSLSSDPRCEGFSGADLNALVREASVAALKGHMSNRLKPSTLLVDCSTTVRPGSTCCSDTSELKPDEKASTLEIQISTPNDSIKLDQGHLTNGNSDKDVVSKSVTQHSFERLSSRDKTNESKSKFKIMVHRKHFDLALEKVKPSVSGKDRVWYENMKERNQRKK